MPTAVLSDHGDNNVLGVLVLFDKREIMSIDIIYSCNLVVYGNQNFD